LKAETSMTRKRNFLCTGLCTATLLLAGTAGALANQVERVPNDRTINGQTFNSGTSTTGPQMNRCWGEMASQLAQLPTGSAVGANGGGMGIHSKSANTPQHTFRDSAFGGTGSRNGIGNASSMTAETGGPHAHSTADGGNGVHAINNGSTTTEGVGFLGQIGFSVAADPLTGALTPEGAAALGLPPSLGTGTAVTTLHCSMEQPVP
jgi:hypothetical protein